MVSTYLIIIMMMVCCGLVVFAAVLGYLLYTSDSSADDDAKTSHSKRRELVVSDGSSKKCTISTFGGTSYDDNGLGFSGVDLFKYPKADVKFRGNKVYPCAVHQDHGSEYLYKVLFVESKSMKSSVYLHVVDVCNRNDSSCKKNVNHHGHNFLVDVHSTAWDKTGLNAQSFTEGTFKVVGSIAPNDLPKSVWNKTDGYIICKCTGKCAGNSVTWKKVGTC